MTFRRTRCPHCRDKLEAGQRIHPACIEGYAEAQEAKAKRKAEKQARMQAKVEKAKDRAAREKQKTIHQLIKEAQREFNAYIRERDRDKPCICCGRPLGSSDVGGAFDCGHYRSTGSASHLRFDERNAHAQRKDCNRWGAGRAIDYRIGLVARIGLEAVESLESDNEIVRWDRDTLRQIKLIYRAKTRALKKENA